MEARLRELIQGNAVGNRTRWALEWKKQGKKVIGTLCSYMPEEIIYAAGMLPWRVTGTWGQDVSFAAPYRPSNTCPFCTHVLQSLLTGELDFLDGVVAANRDYDTLRLWDVWAYLGKSQFAHVMHFPHEDSELCFRQFTKEVRKLVSALEQFGGIRISDESLQDAVELYNKTRILVKQVYELRKRKDPPLSGAEMLGITTAAMIMPKEKFNEEIEALLPYLETRQTALGQARPRLLVASDRLDNPAYLELVESEGCVVAMDDLDTGSRYFWELTDAAPDDPAYALAKACISRSGCPRMGFWDKQMGQVLEWVRDFDIDGVLEMPQVYCHPFAFRAPYFERRMKEAGVPHLNVKRDYHLTHAGQLRTRIGAFLEML